MATVEILKADPATGKFPDRTIDIANVNEAFGYDVGTWDYFTLQVLASGSVTLGSHVLKVQKSNNGADPVDFASAVTQSTDGMTELLDVTAVGYVIVKNTTAGTSGNRRLIARAQRQTR